MKKNYVRDITEARAIELFDKKFGTNLLARLRKLNEEVRELNEAVLMAIDSDGNLTTDIELLEHIDDEISDVHAVISHMGGNRKKYNQELLEMAIDKVNGRETDPMYKRFLKTGRIGISGHGFNDRTEIIANALGRENGRGMVVVCADNIDFEGLHLIHKSKPMRIESPKIEPIHVTKCIIPKEPKPWDRKQMPKNNYKQKRHKK